tara:strand:+ start:886 stop:1566 length:681 start_codon:yes stop_codon:yes gene_type:complete
MKHLLASSSFLVVNKFLAKKIGLKPSVLLADLISKEQYFKENGKCVEGFFFNSRENITKDTTLTRYEQDKAIKKLIDLNFIETKLKGIPAVKHFKINENKIVSFLQTSLIETEHVDCEQVTSNNNKQIKIKNNKSNNIALRLVKFCDEVDNYKDEFAHDTTRSFIDYWTEPNKTGTKMRFEMQKTWETRRRLLTWERNEKKWNKPTGKISTNMNTLNNVKQRLKNL